jgi:hypothetical protein
MRTLAGPFVPWYWMPPIVTQSKPDSVVNVVVRKSVAASKVTVHRS